MLFRMKSSRGDGKLSFQDFISWFGAVIEPASDFYFRHDTKHAIEEKAPVNGEWKGVRDASTLAME